MNVKKYLPNVFIIILLMMIGVAWILPNIGSYLPLNKIINIGITLIFFFYGLKLSPAKMMEGMSNWRMHLTVQSATFILFPLLVLPLHFVVKGTALEPYWLGLFFLSALPSAVSSSVVMVSIAKGNIAGAIFNAGLSGIVGIFATPLWMSFFLIKTGQVSDFSGIIIKLILQIVVPVVAGLLLHNVFKKWTNRYNKQLTTFDKTIIVLVVYQSFSQSFSSGAFNQMSITILIGIMLSVATLFFVGITLINKMCRLFNFNNSDSITILFCGTKKSLVHGTVMAGILFSQQAGGGIFIIPVMIYHALQLFYISYLAHKIGNKTV